MSEATSGSARAERVWVRFLAVGGAWVLAHGAGLLGPLADATFVLLGAAALVATVLGIRWYRPPLRWPWFAMCGAFVLFLVGGAARVALGTLGDLTEHRALLPDLITLPGYLLLGAGIFGFARSTGRGRRGEDLDAILDGVVAALASLTLAWILFINPVLFHAHAPLEVRVLLAAYPPMSVFLVAITARLAFNAEGSPSPAHRGLLTATGVMLVGDVVYMLVDAGLAGVPERVVDLPYAIAYLAIAAAALHPSMARLGDPVAPRERAPTRPRLAIVGAALGIPALVSVTREEAVTGDRAVLAATILALTAAAIWRLFRALRASARAEARLAHQATHDVLTGLPNRALTEDHVARALARARARGRQVALLFLDVDHFKLVNDTLGHSLGDELLVAVARRLVRCVRPGDLVARIGGDEFVVVLDDVVDVDDAVGFADSLRCGFHAPFVVRGSEISSSVSIGIAIADGEDAAADSETLVRDADTAMYEAKAGGRDGVVLFDRSMRTQAAERLALQHDLRRALDLGQMSLHFQPVVGLRGAPVAGVEALLRWTHPRRGRVSPAKFIPVAEESGLITEIGAWVLHRACAEVVRWRRELPGGADLFVSVNLSARQLRDPGFVDVVEATLSFHDLPPDALCLELTESLLMDNGNTAGEALSVLHALGVRLAVDDFGTGYSSLAYLKRFPVDHVKIDRAFVDGLDRDDSSEATLVAAIVAMTRALGMGTIAEGVETVDQQAHLAALGCDLAQGYLYSRPVIAEALPAAVEDLVVRSAQRPLPAPALSDLV